MMQVVCPDALATQRVGAALAGLLRAGDIVLLDGDLGAGKTTLTQGLAAAVGVAEAVTSPTFTLMRTYPTDAGWVLCHVDVYRLERLSEVEDLAIPEVLDDGAVAIIEWGQRATGALPATYLQVALEVGEDGASRVLTFNPVGARWVKARSEIESAVTAA